MIRIIKQNIVLLLSKIWYSFRKRDKRIWVFGEWFGERYGDNCYYFVKYIADNHSEIQLYWVAKDTCNPLFLPNKVKILEKDTKESIKLLKKAGAVFVIQGAGDLTSGNICYWGNALFVNFWHGVPWKKIGGDKIKSKLQKIYYKYWVRKFEANIFLSTSEEFDKIYRRSYNLKDSLIVKAGYPRNSIFYNQTEILKCRRRLEKSLVALNIKIEKTSRIITYMPTFRDNTNEVFSFDSIMNDNRLISILDKYNAIIVEKGHFVSEQRKGSTEVNNDSRYIRLTGYPSQELLAASDVLITDYSSCFFDFLLLDRPIIHYLYDYSYYENDDRGLFYPQDEVVCGDVANDVNQLIKSIEENLLNPRKDIQLRKNRRNMYMTYETADSCERIYDDISTRLEIRHKGNDN